MRTTLAGPQNGLGLDSRGLRIRDCISAHQVICMEFGLVFGFLLNHIGGFPLPRGVGESNVRHRYGICHHFGANVEIVHQSGCQCQELVFSSGNLKNKRPWIQGLASNRLEAGCSVQLPKSLPYAHSRRGRCLRRPNGPQVKLRLDCNV